MDEHDPNYAVSEKLLDEHLGEMKRIANGAYYTGWITGFLFGAFIGWTLFAFMYW